jgi:RHS repeat-associated protein
VAAEGGFTATYDALGRRLAFNDGTSNHRLVYDGATDIAEYSGLDLSGPVSESVIGSSIDERIEIATNGHTYVVHRDFVGSTRMVSDEAGAIQVRFDFDPYGRMAPASDPIGIRHRFMGREWDQGLGLYHFRARHYDFTTARFLQRDPKESAIERSAYQAFAGNPLLFVDPMGTETHAGDTAAPSEKLAPSPDDRPAQTGGPGATTIWDTAQRSKYLETAKANSDEAVRAIQAAKEAQDAEKAMQIAQEVSTARNELRAATQADMTPGGRVMSKALEGDRSWASLLEKYGTSDPYETAERIAQAAGRSRGSLRVLTKIGKVLGPVGVIFGGGVGIYAIYKAPAASRKRVAAEEAGGFAGGAIGGTVGTAAGVSAAGGIAVAIGIASGPPGWLVLALGAIGGGVGGYYGAKHGRKAGGAIYDALPAHYDPYLRSPDGVIIDLRTGHAWVGPGAKF